MKTIFKNTTYAVASICLLSGCASIVSDSKYPVTINSFPEGAKITVKNKHGMTLFQSATPTMVTLDAGDGFFSSAKYFVSYEKDGYDKVTTTISSRLDGWYFGNILFGGLIGILIVDPATGAMWKIDDYTTVTLNASEKTAQTGLKVYDISEVPEDLKDQMVRVK